MQELNNEDQKETTLNSIRRKYKGRGRRKKINSESEINSTTTREIIFQSEVVQQKQIQPIIQAEKIIINEDSNNRRALAMSLPIESNTKITKTRTLFEDGDAGKSRRQQIIITKNVINESSGTKNNSRNTSERKEERAESRSRRGNEERGKIISIKNISTNSSTTNINERSSNKGNITRNLSQGKIVEIKQEINNGQRQNSRDGSTSRKNAISQADTYQRNTSGDGRSSRKNIISQVDTYQRNSSGDGRGSRKNIIKQVDIHQRNTSGDGRSSRKNIINQVDTYQRNTSGDGRSSRKNIIKQVDTYQRNTDGDGKSSRKNIIKQVDTYQRNTDGDGRSSRKNIIKQVDTYQEQNFRDRNKNQGRSELNTSQRANSRSGSQNSKGHVTKEYTTNTTTINRRSGGNPFKDNTNETTIKKLHQNYSFYQDPKSRTMTNMGYHASNNNKISIKEYDSNKRSSRNSSSTKKNNEKVEPNTIKVNKVLVANKDNNNNRKIYSIKTTPIIKTNNNNYNTNNYNKINNKYDTNTNKANNSIASKLAINELKPKEINPFASMKNFYKKDNLSFHIINESVKKQKKPYVLHVRKLERISSNSKLRRSCYNEKEPITHNLNYKSVIVKRASETNLLSKKNNENKLNNNILVIDTSKKDINKSGKLAKKQIYVNPKKNDILKSNKIQSNTNMRMSYNNSNNNNKYNTAIKTKDATSNDIHYKMLSVKNISEEENLIKEKDVANRMSYLNNIFKLNQGKQELNERQNLAKTQIYDTNRKSDILKSAKNQSNINSNTKMRTSYNSDMKKNNSLSNDIHYKMLTVKNVSEEENLINEKDIANRMSFLNSIFKINTGRPELNKTEKITKVPVYDTQRKSDIIKSNKVQTNSHMRMSYNNNGNNKYNTVIKTKDATSNDIHHKILSISNLSEEENLINEKDIANRMSYLNNIFKLNQGKQELNERQNLTKTQTYDTNRKNDIIKPESLKSYINTNTKMRTSYNSDMKKNNSLSNDIHYKMLTVKNLSEEENLINEEDVANRLNYLHSIFKINTENNNLNQNSYKKSEITKSTYTSKRSNRKIFNSGNLGTDSQNLEIKKTQSIKYGSRSNSRGNSRSNSISNYENVNESTFTTTKPIRRTTSEIEFSQRRREKKI